MRLTYDDATKEFRLLETTYKDSTLPKSAGFRWNADQRFWWTGNAHTANHITKSTVVEIPDDVYDVLQSRLEVDFDPDLPRLTYDPDNELFCFHAPYELSHVGKSADFTWNPKLRLLTTPFYDKAKALIAYADSDCKEAIEREQATYQKNLTASHSAETPSIEIPSPIGLEFFPYQRAGIHFALNNKQTLIADEMGLGKTIQAIGVVNAADDINSVLVICPASLKVNWQREFEAWCTKKIHVGIATGKQFPDSGHNVVVINYENVARHRQLIDSRKWNLLVCDESHYLKNPKSGRTHAVLGYKTQPAISADYRIFLTGTPILNRPIELWPLCRALDPKGLGSNYSVFAKKYCAGRETRFGFDVSGASNLNELQLRMRSRFMIRRQKADVLRELPVKVRQVLSLEVPDQDIQSVIDRQKELYVTMEKERKMVGITKPPAQSTEEANSDYNERVAKLRANFNAHFSEMSKLRHDLAVVKIPLVIAHIKSLLEESEIPKVVVFGHHVDVVEQVAEAFGDAAVSITGKTSLSARQSAVDRFQNDPTLKVFVGNIKAAGVGLTLTASSHVVMAELDWVPGNVTQAEDRCHRIGQKDSVFVQHLVFDNSLDAHLAQVICKKQKVIDKALDVKAPTPQVEDDISICELIDDGLLLVDGLSASRAAAVEDAARYIDGLHEHGQEPELPPLSPTEQAAILANARYMAGQCDGAVLLDDRGYNRMDTFFGHWVASLDSLTPKAAHAARHMLGKYVGQLGEEKVSAMWQDTGSIEDQDELAPDSNYHSMEVS